jgi:hypothetical protein
MLKVKDLIYLNNLNIAEEQINEQLEILNKNNSFIELEECATPKNGIKVINDLKEFISIFDANANNYLMCKFVPASGAATRMFKRLISFLEEKENYPYDQGGLYSVKNTIDNIKKFAFSEKIEECVEDLNDKYEIVDAILYSCLNYSNLPKGLLDFHKYIADVKTAFEEHIFEARMISDKLKKIHFTISEEYQSLFNEKLDEIGSKIEISDIEISFSYQDKSTDTIAILENGKIARNKDGEILLRPGGHGALIKNLNEIDADIVFIKNIDNVVHQSLLEKNIDYKKLLGGILIQSVQNIHKHFHLVNNDQESAIEKTLVFLENEFGISPNLDNKTYQERKEILLALLNKPIRVCGMVQNTGEPGGGPFWVKNNDDVKSLQIIEKAQINLDNLKQKEIFDKSTHFNPVDLVCYLKNPLDEKFDLYEFVDKRSSFVSEKTYQGEKIRVLEHPGLWNGAMANWLTIFVDVPLITFNPVKELNDLLRKEHLG